MSNQGSNGGQGNGNNSNSQGQNQANTYGPTQPVHHVYEKGVEVAVWEREGVGRPTFHYQPSRSYRGSDGQYQKSMTFREQDLPYLKRAIEKAEAWVQEHRHEQVIKHAQAARPMATAQVDGQSLKNQRVAPRRQEVSPPAQGKVTLDRVVDRVMVEVEQRMVKLQEKFWDNVKSTLDADHKIKKQSHKHGR